MAYKQNTEMIDLVWEWYEELADLAIGVLELENYLSQDCENSSDLERVQLMQAKALKIQEQVQRKWKEANGGHY